MHDVNAGAADSAGRPWAGREFEPNTFSDDDGSAPPLLIETIERFRVGEAGAADVVDQLRNVRLLIPLVAALGEAATGAHGLTVDKSAELSIVTVAGPDGRNVMPVFSSVAAMQHWNAKARPVPASAERVALAAASEQTDLVVLDPTSATEFVIRRPALWAMAQSQPWQPSYLDPAVRNEFVASIESENDIVSVSLHAGDADARLHGPELLVKLSLVAGLTQTHLANLLRRLQSRWAESQIIATRVDSLTVQLTAAD
jgi:hypothetical protein